ncbi:hypothetical protein ACVWWO_008734 [Bradyrhizobium sp. F1.13.1]
MDRAAGFDVLFVDAIMPVGINGRLLAVKIDNRRPGTLHVGYSENAIIHHGMLDPGLPCSASRPGRSLLPPLWRFSSRTALPMRR